VIEKLRWAPGIQLGLTHQSSSVKKITLLGKISIKESILKLFLN